VAARRPAQVSLGLACADELSAVIEAISRLKDFLDHVAMLVLTLLDRRALMSPSPVGELERL
jgi:hypothetical protein